MIFELFSTAFGDLSALVNSKIAAMQNVAQHTEADILISLLAAISAVANTPVAHANDTIAEINFVTTKLLLFCLC